MLYIAGGSVSLTGQSTINLTASTTGTYKGIVMFQSRSNLAPLKLAGNAGTVPVVLAGSRAQLDAGHPRHRERDLQREGDRRVSKSRSRRP